MTQPKADHGYQNEVSWNGGQGGQPYANQGQKEEGPATGDDGFTAGNRGDLSGRTADQMKEAGGTPE